MNKLIILRGYPGSGKTTIGNALANDGIGVFVDHNSILTFVAKMTENDDGIYDDIVNLELAITRKLLSEGKTAIVARGFSGLNSIEPYITLAQLLNVEYQIIRLEVDETILVDRVQSPERQDDFNPTTTPEALKSWISENKLQDVENEVIVDNTKALVEVLDIIKNTVT